MQLCPTVRGQEMGKNSRPFPVPHKIPVPFLILPIYQEKENKMPVEYVSWETYIQVKDYCNANLFKLVVGYTLYKRISV